MRNIEKGIPDDTPENIAHAIKTILEEEANRLGVSPPTWDYRCDNAGIIVTLDVKDKAKGKWFRIYLLFVDSEHTMLKSADGRSFISWGNSSQTLGKWKLQLLPNDSYTKHKSPPFIWALYREDEDYLQQPPPSPTALLDGRLLRKLLREALGLG